MSWWLWCAVGLVFVFLELFVPLGFLLLLLGASCLVVGGLVALNAAGPDWMHWCLLAVLFVASVATLRKRLMDGFGAVGYGPTHNLEGKEILISADIKPNEFGQGEYSGTPWKVKNCRSSVLEKGNRYAVTKRDGLTLEIH